MKMLKKFCIASSKILAYTFFTTAILLTVYPLFWLIISSLKPTIEIIKYPLALPKEWAPINFKDALEIGKLGKFALNSLIYSGAAALLTTTFALMCSYALAKIKLKVTKLLKYLFLIAIFIPIQAIIMPLFMLVNMMDLYNTKVSIIIIYTAVNLPIAIYLATNYINKIPDSIMEAAQLEGASSFRMITEIMLPLCKPIILTIAFLTALRCWNEFYIPYIMTDSDYARPLIVTIYKFNGCFCNEYGMQFASLAIDLILKVPFIIFFFAFRDKIFEGLKAGLRK